MPKFNEFLFGKKGKAKKLDTLTPDQQQLMKLITDSLAGGEGALSDLFGQFDKSAFEEGVSKPALQQFQDEILPQIQEKFSFGGQAGGSGFQRAGAKAATDLQAKLAQLMYDAQNQQKQNKLQGINQALGTRAFENIYKPGTEGAAQGFIKGIGNGLGNVLGSNLPGGISSLASAAQTAIAG